MVELYSHQKKALETLVPGSILVGGVGSGKSITALAYFYNKICEGNYETRSFPHKPKDLYIITTAKKRDSLEWNSEFSQFGLSTNRNCSMAQIQVTVDSWNNIKKYVDVTGSFFIFDEQRVVGYGAWSKTFINIAKNNEWILLTATPGDTWSDYIPVFIANGFYKHKYDFCQQHVIYKPFTQYSQIDRYVNTGRLIYYRSKILIDMEYIKDTVQHHSFVTCRFNRDKYNRIVKDRWNIFDDCPIENPSQLCYLMRRVVNSDPSRLEAVARTLEFKNKLIIFYNFDYELEMLREFSKDIKILCQEWNGHKHELVPKGDRWIYLVQYSSGSEAWNCIETDAMIFYSENYSYKMMKQAAGRIDRRNTPYKDLYYWHLTSKSPIDNAIRNCQAKKKDFNEKRFVDKMAREKNLAYNRREG
jgi:hypothetical protein